ncbi:hypothetical protein F5Y08DRAFT_335958 [Xylaria arbuscula]|nr:hypothetical protein F5Y08DRAFT_335958 [Xylaria arbuscula]
MRHYLPSITLVWLIWLLFGFLYPVQAAINFVSHAHERVWLWELYETVTEIEGADKQKMIFAQNPEAKIKPLRNIGTGPNGKLTYAEFQARLEKINPEELNDRGWNAQLDVTNIDPSLRKEDYLERDRKGKRGSKFNSKDPYNTAYNDLVEKAEKKFNQYREENKHAVVAKKLGIVKEILGRITTLRMEDTSSFLFKQMQQDGSKNGLGLSADDIVAERDQPSKVTLGPKWDKVNIAETFTKGWANPDIMKKLQATGFKNLKDSIRWADNLGDPGKARSGPPYTDMNRGHFRALKSWKVAFKRINLPVASLQACA